MHTKFYLLTALPGRRWLKEGGASFKVKTVFHMKFQNLANVPFQIILYKQRPLLYVVLYVPELLVISIVSLFVYAILISLRLNYGHIFYNCHILSRVLFSRVFYLPGKLGNVKEKPAGKTCSIRKKKRLTPSICLAKFCLAAYV